MPVLGRDYELARRERNAKRDPVRVVMGGEEFTLLPTVPLSTGFDLVDAPEPGDDVSLEAPAIRAICTTIRLALIDEDQQRWDALLTRRADAIDGADILYYGTLIVEAYSGRPTVPSSGSTGGRHTSGATSKRRGPKAVTSAT